MTCLYKKERDYLQQADISLAQYFSSFGSILSKLSSLSLCYSHSCGKGQPPTQEMDRGRDNVGLADLKVNLRCLYDIVAIGIMDNRETAKEVKKLVDAVSYASYQIDNHDARIDDNEMNLKEIMGKVDRIQEDLHLLVQLNQGSQAHENPVGAVQNMVEESVAQPMGHPGNP